MSFEDLEKGRDFGRYLDVDGDGIPWRTLPGTHPTRGAYFTRGTSRDRYARYTEEGGPYVDNMERLLRKFDDGAFAAAAGRNAQGVGADPRRRDPLRLHRGGDGRGLRSAAGGPAACGRAAAARLSLRRRGRGDFIDDARTDLRRRAEPRRADAHRCSSTISLEPARFVSILHYDGTPITARFIGREIAARMQAKPPPHRRRRSS